MSEASPGFLDLALSPRVVRRALLYALVVGAILIAINHGDALLAGHVGSERWWKMGLTVLVPYTVSTLSSVGALRSVSRR
jgi:Mg/Co/Ni transporter MgtE